MSSAPLLDTRTPYRSAQRRLSTSAPTSQTGSPGLTLFRRAVHELIRSGHRERAVRRTNVSDRLRSSRDPMGYINELIDQCAVRGGPEGLDIAIDVLSQSGDLAIRYAREFWKKDVGRWGSAQDAHRHHMNDDAWYILLRAVAQSDLEAWQKTQMLLSCATDGPKGVREASIHALGDMGGAVAIRLLHRLRDTDPSPMVRAAATEVLNDLEG